jgi:hypothetical protein
MGLDEQHWRKVIHDEIAALNPSEFMHWMFTTEVLERDVVLKKIKGD